MVLFTDDLGLPWGEIIASVGTLIVLLLTIGNNKLKKILQETKTNGGSSLRDQISRIEKSVGNLSLWVEAGHHLSEKPMFRTDSKGNFVWVNNAFISLTGKSLESLSNLGWISSIHEDDRARVANEWVKAVEDKRTFESDFRILTSLHEIKEVRARACPTSPSPTPLGYLGYWILIEEIGFN